MEIQKLIILVNQNEPNILPTIYKWKTQNHTTP